MTLCNVCGEPEAAGQHPIRPDVARGFRPIACRACGGLAQARCMLGLGDIVYVCINGHVWGTVSRPARQNIP
jgi:hypothetical protein